MTVHFVLVTQSLICTCDLLGSFHSASALLCPLTGTSLASPIHKHVTSVGLGKSRQWLMWILFDLHPLLGKGADVCLSEYGHCNFISSKHACIFYDKVRCLVMCVHTLMVHGVVIIFSLPSGYSRL